MKVRRIDLDQDYPVIKTWWERRGSEAPSVVLLPPVGIIAEVENLPIACAFLYQDVGGLVAMVEWEATNPDCHSPMQTIRALNMVFDFFERYAIDQGFSVLLSWVAEKRGDGRILERRHWGKCPGDRHTLMAYQPSDPKTTCPP